MEPIASECFPLCEKSYRAFHSMKSLTLGSSRKISYHVKENNGMNKSTTGRLDAFSLLD